MTSVSTVGKSRRTGGGAGAAFGENGFNAAPFVGGASGLLLQSSGGGGASGFANGGDGGNANQSGFPGTGLGAGGGGGGIGPGPIPGGQGGLAQIRFLFTKNAI